MKTIFSPDAPAPNGHYSQAVVANGLVFLAAQLPLSADPDEPLSADLAAQTRQVVTNCRNILDAAGSGLGHVVSATVYLTDIEGWPVVNSVLAEAFGSHRPARAVAGVAALHLGAMIAIQMTAALPTDGDREAR